MKEVLAKDITGILILLAFLTGCTSGTEDRLEQTWEANVVEHGLRITLTETGQSIVFQPRFTVLVRSENPNLALRPGNIPGVRYNVATWENPDLDAEHYLGARARDEAQVGDGFDNRVLKGKIDKS